MSAAPGLTVRRLGPDDWQTYRSIRLEMLRESPTAFLTTHAEAAAHPEEVWRRRLAGGSTLLAELDGEAVGSVTCWAGAPGAPPHAADLGAMYVAPSARRGGVGEALVTAAVDEARARGQHVVRLEVERGNRAARSLYERLGFRATGPGTPRRGRPELQDVPMERALDGACEAGDDDGAARMPPGPAS